MFEFVTERKVNAILDRICARLPQSMATCSGLERCAAKAVANAYLIKGSEKFGRTFSHDPASLDTNAVYSAILELSEIHHAKLSVAGQLGDKPIEDPILSAWKWEMVALELVIVTVACSLRADVRKAARVAWGALYPLSLYVDEAVAELERYGQIYAISPIPDIAGRRADAYLLKSLASCMPPMFR